MTLKDEIQATHNQLAEAISAGDASRAITLYTDDARVIPHGGPICASRDAIRAFLDGAVQSGITAARFTTQEVDGDSAQAIEIGRYELFAPTPEGDRTRVADGRYLMVWRKVGEHWRIHRDMFGPQ